MERGQARHIPGSCPRSMFHPSTPFHVSTMGRSGLPYRVFQVFHRVAQVVERIVHAVYRVFRSLVSFGRLQVFRHVIHVLLLFVSQAFQ